MNKRNIGLIIALLLCSPAFSQVRFNPDTVKAGLFDNGKMWTFDFPPVAYFEKTYQFKPDQEWFDGVRMSALRFASWCSASFVSSDGLVMTNHHCSRDVALKVQQAGENFNDNGFYAETLGQERRIPDLYVDQLVLLEDITARVQKAFDLGKTDEEKIQRRMAEFEAIKKEYEQKDVWKGLTLQPITLYQGAHYSLYGFKRYTDVRLVAMPELALGFFGGDYDNFTYPRYCLDFTFFRVYDDNGKPYNPKYYFKFNPNGVKENEPVFVVGNPGSTNRQATVSMLEYFRDVQWPTILGRLNARSAILQQYNKTIKSDSILNIVFRYENSIKAISGFLEGVRDPYIMARRKAFEREFQNAVAKNNSPQRPESFKNKNPLSLWDEIASTQAQIKNVYFEANLFAPNEFNSMLYDHAALLNIYAMVAESEPKRSTMIREYLLENHKTVDEVEINYLATHFTEIKNALGGNDPYVKAAWKGKSAVESALYFIKNSKANDLSFRKDLLNQGSKAIMDSKDPMLALARMAASRYEVAQAKIKKLNAQMASLRSKLSLLLYSVYGTRIPPDATFSLRFADGRVTGYSYNGTKAPLHTTFFGLYDRYYSFEGTYPWDLPNKWKNPPVELLKEPMNFISTNDIIGGNSGSPMINRNREVVGLIFDSNMEGLPGNFIYLPEKNRTVSVHAGGIIAGLKYIYKADRIVKELLK